MTNDYPFENFWDNNKAGVDDRHEYDYDWILIIGKAAQRAEFWGFHRNFKAHWRNMCEADALTNGMAYYTLRYLRVVRVWMGWKSEYELVEKVSMNGLKKWENEL